MRRLLHCFRALHGPPTSQWLFWLMDCPYFEVFEPHRRGLPPFKSIQPGVIYSDGKHVNAQVVRVDRPHVLGDPFKLAALSGEACSLLMLYGGAASDWAQQYSLQLYGSYSSASADAARDAELNRLAQLVADGASVVLRGADDPEHARCVAVALEARLRRLISVGSSSPSAGSSPYSLGTVASVQRSRVLSVKRAWGTVIDSVPPSWCGLHVRRLKPPRDVWQEQSSAPSPRLSAAVQALQVSVRSGDAVGMVIRQQPFAFAGAVVEERVPVLEAPSAFSHRRLEPRPDAESLAMPHVVANVPPVQPYDLEPLPDPPSGLVAHRVEDVVPRTQLRLFRTWARRMDSALKLAESGQHRAAVRAAPNDLFIDARYHTKSPFRGCVMDFSSYPYRPLLPSRWPDRPPRSDISIRGFRREFRAHPSYPDRMLRGMLSHGNPEVGDLAMVSYFAGPHGSSLAHVEPWRVQMQKEVSNGWGRTAFHGSYGLASWPQRCQPTSMVERHGAWRLCHDMSWPPSHPDVESPNDADVDVMLIVFMQLRHFASSISIFIVSGLPVKVWKGDLSKAYKRTGQQNASMWRRTCYGMQRSQTLDVICFGQRDGPASFTRQTHFMVHVVTVELEFADASYPPVDAAVLAFLGARRDAAVAAASADVRRWLSLFWLMAMIDDFGGVSIDDALHRIDGSPVLDEFGAVRGRAWLHFEVFQSVIRRLGHRLEPGDPLKYAAPCLFMGLLGGGIDVVAEELVLDEDKRTRYAALLRGALLRVSVSVKELTSLAFKMLVVCEMRPLARQWLHPLFRVLRGGRVAPVSLHIELEVTASLQSFLQLLDGAFRISVPMACRESFPFADVSALLVVFADASGDEPSGGPREPGSREPPCRTCRSSPGYGAWAVRGSELFVVHGLWSADESRALSISVLEYIISWWAVVLFAARHPDASHVLEFTDNSGAEWSARREAPSAALMQRVTARRSEDLRRSGVFVRTCRVPSTGNTWADGLSRQRVDAVYAEAAALGLVVVRLHVPPALRDLTWIVSSRA